jgi:outer membrane lipoprotein SlyB
MAMNEPEQEQVKGSDLTSDHPIAKGIGAIGGGVAGAAIGKSVAGKVGAAVGGIAGAIAGNRAGDAIAEFTEELLRETSPSLSLGLGADTKAIELPAHYSWEELKALSKPRQFISYVCLVPTEAVI